MENQLTEKELQESKDYLKFKRNQALNKFVMAIENFKSLEVIQRRYDNLIRSQKQYFLIDDALVIYRLTNNKKRK